ncbi:MAG: VirB3 family type IV secretion system protein [Pseudomonadota bacterium]|jgi:type IV secretory pathway VirB3-like protein
MSGHPVYKNLTRPIKVFWVPIIPLFSLLMLCMLLGEVSKIFGITSFVGIPIFFVVFAFAAWQSRKDERFFESVIVLAKTGLLYHAQNGVRFHG